MLAFIWNKLGCLDSTSFPSQFFSVATSISPFAPLGGLGSLNHRKVYDLMCHPWKAPLFVLVDSNGAQTYDFYISIGWYKWSSNIWFLSVYFSSNKYYSHLYLSGTTQAKWKAIVYSCGATTNRTLLLRYNNIIP